MLHQHRPSSVPARPTFILAATRRNSCPSDPLILRRLLPPALPLLLGTQAFLPGAAATLLPSTSNVCAPLVAPPRHAAPHPTVATAAPLLPPLCAPSGLLRPRRGLLGERVAAARHGRENMHHLRLHAIALTTPIKAAVIVCAVAKLVAIEFQNAAGREANRRLLNDPSKVFGR